MAPEPQVYGNQVYHMPNEQLALPPGSSTLGLPPGSDNVLPGRPGGGFTVDPFGRVEAGQPGIPTSYGADVITPQGPSAGQLSDRWLKKVGGQPEDTGRPRTQDAAGQGIGNEGTREQESAPVMPAAGPTHMIGDTPVFAQETPTVRRVFRDENGKVVKLAGRKPVAVQDSGVGSQEPVAPPEATPVPPVVPTNPNAPRPLLTVSQAADGSITISPHSDGSPLNVNTSGSAAPLTAGEGSTVARPEFHPVVGAAGTTFTPDNTSVPFHYAVVPIDSLTTSHTQGFTENPAYDQSLQPRDRTRMASAAQIAELAQKLEPARLGAAPTTADGAPLVGKDGQVESGNGRAMALRSAYEQGLPGSSAYKAHLVENAQAYGIDPAQVAGIDKPALVRVSDMEHATPEARSAFAAEAGKPTVAAMSAPETAAADAQRLKQSGALRLLDTARAITSGGNRRFVESFFAGLPTGERAGMVDSDGNLSADGVRRIRAGVLASAYSDPMTLDRMLESTDDSIKNVGRAMEQAAPRIADIRQKIESGQLWPVDISGDLEAAANKLAALRERQASQPVQYKVDRKTFLRKLGIILSKAICLVMVTLYRISCFASWIHSGAAPARSASS